MLTNDISLERALNWLPIYGKNIMIYNVSRAPQDSRGLEGAITSQIVHWMAFFILFHHFDGLIVTSQVLN